MSEEKPREIHFINESKKSGKINLKIKFKSDNKDLVIEEIDMGQEKILPIENFEDIINIYAIIEDENVEFKKENDVYIIEKDDIRLRVLAPKPPYILIDPTVTILVVYSESSDCTKQEVHHLDTLCDYSDMISQMLILHNSGIPMNKTDAPDPTWEGTIRDGSRAINVTAVVHDGG